MLPRRRRPPDHGLSVQAVVLDERGRILECSAGWLAAVPARARRRAAVGVGADYLGVVRRAALLGDVDAEAVANLLEEALSGRISRGSLEYACPTTDRGRFLRLEVTRIASDPVRLLALHLPTDTDGAVWRSWTSALLHDLATPITVGAGWAATLERDGDALDADVYRTGLQSLLRSAQQAAEILADQDARRVAPSRVLVGDAVRAVQTDWPQLRVRSTIERGLAVRCTPTHLARVLRNLAENAAKYGQPPLQVVASQHDNRVRIEVSDAGPGVPDDVVETLFELHTRSVGHRDQEPGTGIGLGIVRQLLRVNGGTIRLLTERPTTTFLIDLPADEPAVE